MTGDATRSSKAPVRVGIVGGGLAGLSAAAILAEFGATVELFESRRRLGGRAGSYEDPGTAQVIDHCQHVGMGCCTYWLDFCRRTGLDALLRRDRTLHFFGPDGRPCRFAGSRWLPPPLHLVPALLRMRYLPWRDRLRVARSLLRLVRRSADDGEDEPTIGDWLRRQGQSEIAMSQFWSVVLASALAETVDRASLGAAQKVFRDGFLGSRGAYEVIVPTVPLGQLYDEELAGWLENRRVAIHRGTPIRGVHEHEGTVRGLSSADDSVRHFDHIVLAVNWRHVLRMLPETLRARLPQLADVDKLESSPIAGVHLWFDRPITPLPHAVLVGRMSQWLFNHGRREGAGPQGEPGHYVQVVISGDRDMGKRSQQEIVDEVLADLRVCFPGVERAQLIHWRLVNQPHAVFSVRPGTDRFRPPQTTPVPGLHLAGDWTQTGWPATMESAVRSGYRAAESVLAAAGQPANCRVNELPQGLLARLLLGAQDFGSRRDSRVSQTPEV